MILCIVTICMKRRNLFLAVGVGSAISLGGCLGGTDDNQTNSGGGGDENNDSGVSEASDGNASSENDNETETEEKQELFDSIEVDGRELVVSLTQDRASEIQIIRVEFPNSEEDQSLKGISTARIGLIEYGAKLPGNWVIQAIDGSDSVVDETSYTAEVELEPSQVGTLAELGIRSDSAADEHNTIQITLENKSNMPIATGGPTNFNSSYGTSYSLTTDRLTERAGFDEQFVAPGKNINLWFRIAGGRTEVEQVLGSTYEASSTIRFKPRIELSVPLSINFEGPIVNDDSRDETYADNTTASLRR